MFLNLTPGTRALADLARSRADRPRAALARPVRPTPRGRLAWAAVAASHPRWRACGTARRADVQFNLHIPHSLDRGRGLQGGL